MTTTIEIPEGVFLDPYLKANRDSGTIFRLQAGNYYTRGCFDFPEHDLCMLAPGCSIVGETGESIIMLDDAVLEHDGKPTGYTEVLTAGARTKGSSVSVVVSGVVIKCSHYPTVPTVGLHVWSSQAMVSNVMVVDLFGDRDATTPVREGFGILVNPGAYSLGPDGGNFVKGCRVDLLKTAKENYCTAIFIGGSKREGVPLLRSHIRVCQTIASDGHAAFAMNDRTSISDCEAVGFRRAVFVDTGPVRDCRIERLDAGDCGWALDLRGTSERRGILVKDSSFSFRAIDGWAQAILLSDDDSGAYVDGVAIDGCTFIAPSDRGRASKARLRGKNVEPFTERNNTWVGNWELPVIQKTV